MTGSPLARSAFFAGSLLLLASWGLVGGCSRSQAAPVRQAGQPLVLASLPDGSIKVLEGDSVLFSMGLSAWGPGWSWAGWEEEKTPGRVKGRFRLNTGASLLVDLVLAADGRSFEVQASADKDTDLTLLALTLGSPSMAGGQFKADSAAPLALPLGINSLGSQVRQMIWTQGQKAILLTFDQPVTATSDGDVRVVLGQGRMSAGQKRVVKGRLSLPGPVQGPAASGAGQEGWYAFQPSLPGSGPDELSLASWLSAPAGREGRIKSQGDQLILGGKPIKLWGLNVCYSDCAPPKELAEKRAEFYARNGINAVRLHKYADGPGWAGIQGPESFASLDPAALDRMDYFVAKLKEKGIFVKLSPTFGVKLGPADAATVPFIREFGGLPKAGERVETKHGSIFLARELQDLQIKQTVAVLQHKNPYTGLTYAQDPAVAIVEAFNEDSALFFGTMDRLQNIPTLRRRAGAAFFEWVRAKYKTKAGLEAAWGEGGLNTFAGEGFTDESWEKGVIYPVGNPWFFDTVQLAGSQKARAPRLFDAMEWLTLQQNAYYDRFKAAIQKAGYGGEILASNWIAGSGFSHYLNLHSDYRIGMIDRHNYFGGANGQVINAGMMVSRPGSGILSSGASQAAGRPFSLSEWIHVFPNEWGAEGPALIGAYGMGLQGWDVSFIFQNRDSGGFSERIGRDQWDATAPQVMGLFPAVSRQVLRGDVAESKEVFARNVHLPSLLQGKLGFDDRSEAQGDVKEAESSTIPSAALAQRRLVVDFVPAAKATQPAAIPPGPIRSATGELTWTPATASSKGWIGVDTPATAAYVGARGGADFPKAWKTAKFEPGPEFMALYATAQGRSETLATARKVLVTAMARAGNTGMKIEGPLLLEVGQGPILLEPVKARINLGRPGGVVHLLDHSGRKTGRTLGLNQGWLEVDTGRDKTPYYLIEYPGP